MKNLTKVTLASSLILGAALFAIGCGGSSSCCNSNAIKAKVNLLSENNLAGGLLPLNDHTLTVNGLASTSDGTITKAVWRAYADCSKNEVIDTKTVSSKDAKVELDLGAPGQHKVCVTVTDTNGLSDEDCTCITVQELNGPSANINGLPQELKAGCPLPTPTGANSITNSGSNQLSYAWTLDGATAGSGVTPSLPSTLTATPNPHEVCLTVTDSNGISNETCQKVNIIPHVAPTAVMKVWNVDNVDQTDIPAGSVLTKSTQYKLSCAGSRDDCPQDAEDIECRWNASSYKAVNGSCDVAESARTYYIQNCFDDNQHTGHGAQTTTPTTDSALVSFITLCGSATEFDCVEVTMTATDKLHGDLNTSIKRVFKAQ